MVKKAIIIYNNVIVSILTVNGIPLPS